MTNKTEPSVPFFQKAEGTAVVAGIFLFATILYLTRWYRTGDDLYLLFAAVVAASTVGAGALALVRYRKNR